ncbi:MAG: bifunctional nuclease family protein [Actinomycetota bacterium]|nr:bifunctional nuclease family protein [Actinomycetota bacterium]
MLKMELHGVNLDMLTNQPVVILKDPAAKRFLPIWIGQFEATAILMEIQGIKPSRPLTHDLLKSVIEQLNASIRHIVIDDLKEGTFFAKIHLDNGTGPLTIDARPSDAIALAVRMEAPIFAEESVLEKASILTEEGENDEVERFRSFLNSVGPEDFGPESGPQG